MTQLTVSTHPKAAALIALLGTFATFMFTAAISCGLVFVTVNLAAPLGLTSSGGKDVHWAVPWFVRLEHITALLAWPRFDDAFAWYRPSSPRLTVAASRAFRSGVLQTAMAQVLLAAAWLTCSTHALQWHTALLCQLGVLIVLVSIEAGITKFQRKSLRNGAPVLTMGEARALFRGASEPRLAWCGQLIGAEETAPHFCLLGPPKTGKTLLMRMLMASAITKRVSRRQRTLVRRAVVFDPKREMHQVLAGQGVHTSDILTLNPFDDRAFYWALAVDFDTPALAKQLAHLLIPDNPKLHDPFWIQASQVILEELICVLQQTAPGRWQLNDVLELMTGNPAHLLHALYRSQRGKAAAARYFGAKRQAISVLASIDAALRPYSAAAAAMARTAIGFSIREWLESRRMNVVVLGTDPGHSEVLEPLNRVFLARLGQLLLDSDLEEPPEEDHIWLFIDELPQLGRVPNLPQVAREARSKGCRIVIAAQSTEVLQAEFGAEEAADLIGLCSNTSFTAANTTGTRNLASQLLGVARTGEDPQARTEDVFVTSQFNEFRLPTKEGGIHVLARVHGSPFWNGFVPPRFVRKRLQEKDESVSAYDRRSSEWSAPLPLTELDYTQRLGLPWPPPNSMDAFSLFTNEGMEDGGAPPATIREPRSRGRFNPL